MHAQFDSNSFHSQSFTSPPTPSDHAPQGGEAVRSDVAQFIPATPLLSPAALRIKHAPSLEASSRIAEARQALSARISRGVGPPVVIVGPCSIHCEEIALDYAKRLARLREDLAGRLQLVMRVYFEKPRTSVGWKGFLYDPDLNGECDLARGLSRARSLLVQIVELGLPIASEVLEPLAAEYFADCFSWVAIGARTSESQIHRQIASSIACPVGFKNATDGSLTTAVQAVEAASQPHTFLGVDDYGSVAVRRSLGNPTGHLVLRGGRTGPNYSREHVQQARALLSQVGSAAALLVDCSHGNSDKDHRRQGEIAREVAKMAVETPQSVAGLMIESNLREGNQDVRAPRDYGVSVTDACISFEETESLLRELGGIGN